MSNDYNLPLERGGEMGAYAGAVSAVSLWGLTASEWAVIASAVLAGMSFIVHLWFSWRRDRREMESHNRVMELTDGDKTSEHEDSS